MFFMTEKIYKFNIIICAFKCRVILRLIATDFYGIILYSNVRVQFTLIYESTQISQIPEIIRN